MSFQAMSWAVTKKCPTPTSKLILILLANYADEHNSCFPSRDKIAELSNCDERTVRRSLKQLSEAGFLRVESRYRPDGGQTSNRYYLSMDNVSEQPSLTGCQEVSSETGGWTNLQGEGVSQMPPNTIRKDTNKNKSKGRTGYPTEFDEWWLVYPRRDGSKAKAFESWQKIVNTGEITIDDLNDATRMFARSRHGQDSRFTPHATTWLNQRRFETVEEVRQQSRNKNQLAG